MPRRSRDLLPALVGITTAPVLIVSMMWATLFSTGRQDGTDSVLSLQLPQLFAAASAHAPLVVSALVLPSVAVVLVLHARRQAR